MAMGIRAIVTGAYSYTGAAVAAELLNYGFSVHTLTQRRAPPNNRLSSSPLMFDPDYLARELRGAEAFINTYWVRLPYAGAGFSDAVRNSQMLIDAAARAGVRRFVQVSVSNAAEGTNLGYYAGKHRVEELLRGAGLSYAIVRPTLIVGPCDVLTNNIAWFLRRFPVFPLPGRGTYRLQPVTLADTARIIVNAVLRPENIELDAAGPDVMTFRDYVAVVAKACGLRRWIVGTPAPLSLAAVRLAGLVLRDIVLTQEELDGLRQELLISHEPPLGRESVSAWLHAHGRKLGKCYAHDLKRHFGTGREHPVITPDALRAGLA